MPGAYFSKQSPFQEEKPQGALRLVGVPANGFVSTGVPKQGASFQTGIHASGTPEGTRTPDLLLRRQLLYPAELLAHFYGAGDGNRTRVSSLEGWCSTIELHPRKPLPERFSFDILAWFLLFVKHFLWHIPTIITKPSLRKNGGCPNRAASITFALITLQTPQPWFPG